MKIYILLLLSLISFSQSFALDSLFTYQYTAEDQRSRSLSDSIDLFIDFEHRLGVEDIAVLADSLFTPSERRTDLEGQLTIWSRIKMVNQEARSQSDFWRFIPGLDSIWVYTFQEGQLIQTQFTGNVLPPSEKSLLGSCNCLPFSLNPNETKTFYFKLKFNSFSKHEQRYPLAHIYVLNGNLQLKQDAANSAWQYFYAGIMMMFFLVSLFMYVIFKERVFIYFGMLVFFFALYFLEAYTLVSTLFDIHILVCLNLLHLFSISGIVIAMFLFASQYIQLAKHYPIMYKVYTALSVVAASFVFIARYFTDDIDLILNILNLLTFTWATFSLVPVVLLVKKKDRFARILLTSVFILFFTNLWDVLVVLDIITVYSQNKSAFQVGTILFTGILFYSLFTKINTIRAEKQRFEDLDHLKSRFFANISHEFRTPLTLILAPLASIKHKLGSHDDQKSIAVIERNANRLLHLINQLLDLSKLEAGKMDMQMQEHNFALLLKGIVMSFESLAKRKNIRLHFVSQKDNMPLWVDKEKVEQIFYNLLSNAFKFTAEYGEISVMISEQNGVIEVLVRDNGLGIPASRIAHIFDRFYQVDSSETREHEGTGIGLALVKELVTLHGGQISVESQVDQGSTFCIHLPKEHKSFAAKDTGHTSSSKTNKLAIIDTAIPATTTNPSLEIDQTERPIILIVEDNKDVRHYIKQHFKADFKIIEADDGQAGIELALEHSPDLIISDVMMPKKDGYQLCKQLKTDQRTSHIPIILLTAKAAQEEKLRGLEIGADDYLIKPFNTQELEIRTKNLIASRVQLRKLFSENTQSPQLPKGLNKIDRAFLEKVQQVVNTNLNNEQFNVELFAQELNMSRVHLNRKLKALTDLSANKYIQTVRLQKAMNLLQQQAGNVSEIAFQTGFKSTAYFVKCFREKYGKTPGSLLEKQ